jgi:transketolase
MRKKFVEVTTKIFQLDHKVILLLGDIGVFSFNALSVQYPTRVINTGIMEQTMIGFAAGLSKSGLVPIVHSINPFLIERALEQIKIDFAYQELPGNIVSVGASYDYAGLGPTHHGPADIPILFNIPNACIFVPGSKEEFEELFIANYNNGKLNYFRISEFMNSKSLNHEEFVVKNPNSKKYILVVGSLMDNVLNAANTKDYNIVYLNQIKVLSQSLIVQLKYAQEILTVEPYYPGTLLTILNSQGVFCKIRIIGVKREFHNFYGSFEDHLSYDGLDANSMRKFIENDL